MPTPTAHLYLDSNRGISPISPVLFSGFAEHMGRCIYGGIYDPGSPLADERGLRRDVLAALRELNFRTIRYPGGNFLSAYRWLDGVGPRDQRPRRRDLAWQSIESNQFGTHEFMDFCREINTEPMLGVNLGTGTIQDAADLVEYCNAPVGTQYADLRAAHGQAEPFGVRYWCLGNEMDGWWQLGHLEAAEYGHKAREAAKMMRWHDPALKLISCGSASTWVPTYPEWDRTVLEICWDQVDYHSMHYYAENVANDTASFLARTLHFENFVDTLAGVLRYVKARLRSKHEVYLSWDEWNVAYKLTPPDQVQRDWVEAPPIAEEIYNLEDALVVAQWLNVFLRKADVVKITSIAQIVNVIAPILTRPAGLLKQSIYYPLVLFSQLASGHSLDVLVQSPQVDTAQYGAVPMLDAAAAHDVENSRQAIFIVNRSQTESLPLELHWQAAVPTHIERAFQMAGSDPKAINTFENPNVVTTVPITVPHIVDGRAELRLPPLSFTVIDARLPSP
jgi:alpha-L-arabinofuranosidase